MCGVIGVHLKEYTRELGELVRRVFRESEVRGMHATGLTYFQNGKLTTIKEPVKASDFINTINFETMLHDGGLFLIGHCRYSTSDLEYNQPMESETMCLVHNGVITQEPKYNWRYDVEGGNDSMLLLASLLEDKLPHEEWPDASMAFCSLNDQGEMRVFRNGKRPLYRSWLDDESVFITSTQDIAKRAGLFNTKEVANLEDQTYYTGSAAESVFWERNNVDLQEKKIVR
jgi:glutamine phosphoribosylpyrophosphate amidotransferase